MGKNKMCALKPGEPPFLDALWMPRFYCKKCGRVARDPAFLCKPKDLPVPRSETEDGGTLPRPNPSSAAPTDAPE